MREIKFRGRSINGWLYGEAIWFNEFPTLKDKQIYMPNPNNENCDEFNIETWSMVFDVGQYTELKDKKGKEIYEGDILKGTKKGKPDEVLSITYVKWDRGQFDLYTEMTSDSWEDALYNYMQFFDVEVIGNIYENSELLKGEI